MAVLQYATDFAHESLHWAVSEAQRCFNAPLDHTRHHPVEPFPELVNKPTGNPYFDRMLKPDTAPKSLELAEQEDTQHMKHQTDMEQDKKQCQNQDACISVKVIKEDGTSILSKHSLPLDSTGTVDVDPSSTGASLTKRSSPDAMSDVVKHVLDFSEEQIELDYVKMQKQLDQRPALGIVHNLHQGTGSTSFSNDDVETDCPGDTPESVSNPSRPDDLEHSTLDETPVDAMPVDMKRHSKEEDASAEVEPQGALPEVGADDDRNHWDVGSVLEIFTASANAWFPGLVTDIVRNQNKDEMLTAQFWVTMDDAKQKTVCRQSKHLAPIGTHCGDKLPPGFEIGFSKSRPGMFVFLDGTTGLKYDSLALVWAVHFKRWLERPAAEGMETISSVVPVVASRAATRQHSEVSNVNATLMTQVVPAAEASADVCNTDPCEASLLNHIAKTAVADSKTLFLEAMAHESPGSFACPATSAAQQFQQNESRSEGQAAFQSVTEPKLSEACPPAIATQIPPMQNSEDNPATILAEIRMTEEFFASLPESNQEQSPAAPEKRRE
jgi:hypothetical protein